MKISSLEVSKYRNLLREGDDTVLLLPELVGVFDGATSASSNTKKVSPGKLASKVAASVVAKLQSLGTLSEMTLQEVCDEVHRAIVSESTEFDESVLPSTTMAVASLEESTVRLLLVGDSGIRINGQDLYQPHKKIDDVSTEARIAVFNLLKDSSSNSDELEYLCREIIFLGLDHAVAQRHLSAEDADAVIKISLSAGYTADEGQIAEEFLKGGIKTQHRFANATDLPFGYSALCKTKFAMIDALELRLDRKDVRTIEVFSDGYFSLPKSGVSICDWEREFSIIESQDFHKISEYRGVKGSTTGEFADDRSLVVVEIGRAKN